LPQIGVRTGSHPGYGRVVFDLLPDMAYTVDRHNEHVSITFPAGANLAKPPALPRNVVGLVAGGRNADITVSPGAAIRLYRLGDRLVVDVADAGGGSNAIAAPVPLNRSPERPKPVLAAPDRVADGAAWPASGPPRPLDARMRAAESSPPALPPAPTSPANVAPSPDLAAAASLPATLSIAAVRSDRHAVTLPFAPATGAAAFRRGNDGFVVFDERRPIDLAALRDDPAFASATISLLPAGTILRIPLSARDAIVLARVDTSWRVEIAQREAVVTPIRPGVDHGRLVLPAADAGGIVSMPDPMTGGAILVGVQKRAGQFIPVPRQMPEFEILATWQGVAIAPRADRIALQATAAGFVLSAGPVARLALGAADGTPLVAADAFGLSRRFDFPDQPQDALLRRLQAAIASAAAAPAQARSSKRLEVAQAMIALGMGAEAQSLMSLSGSDDGRAVDNPDVIGLGAIAALLAGRPNEADGLRDPRLSGTDEIAFWRAVLLAQTPDGGTRAAPILAATRKLANAYPAPLRARLMPLIAEALVAGGEQEAAKAFLADNGADRSLDLARAMLAAPRDPAAALKLYDLVAVGSDRRARAKALAQSVELRLATHAITPARAADELDRQVYAWRGDAQELGLRQRGAALRADAGDPRRALSQLREAVALFPEAEDALRADMTRVFTNAIQHEGLQILAPLDLIAMVTENADLLPDGPVGQRLASAVADRLLALDLPNRAQAALQKLIVETPPGEARTELGARLAGVQLDGGDADAAIRSLTETLHPGPLNAETLQTRTLIFARAAAKTGHLEDGLAALRQLDSDKALDLMAALQETAQLWPDATATLRRWVDRVVPPAGQLGEAQARAILRLATAAAQSGDEAVLGQLAEHDTARMPEGPSREMFQLLTSRPVRAANDLPRAAQETQKARNMFGARTASR
jgi:hypothetical protein